LTVWCFVEEIYHYYKEMAENWQVLSWLESYLSYNGLDQVFANLIAGKTTPEQALEDMNTRIKFLLEEWDEYLELN